jgi:hypothetical protein
MNNFLERALPFSFLLNKGYRLKEQEVSNSFDNGFLHFCSSVMEIRVVRDRGHFTVDFAPVRAKRDDYFDLDLVLQFLDGLKYWERNSKLYSKISKGDPDTRATFLQQRLTQIESAFHPDHFASTKEQLGKLQKQRAKIMFS